MKIQSVTKSVKKMWGKGRVLVAGAAASVVPMVYSGMAYAQTASLDTLGSSAGDKIEGIADQLAVPALAIIGIAVGIATVAVVLRLTKKS